MKKRRLGCRTPLPTIEEGRKLRAAINKLPASGRVYVLDVRKAIGWAFGIRENEILTHDRRRVVVRPRMFAMALAMLLCKRSSPYVGRYFNRDHATVLNAVFRFGEFVRDQHQQVRIEQATRDVREFYGPHYADLFGTTPIETLVTHA